MIKLNGLNIAGIYLILKNKESELDKNLLSLFNEIEEYLYGRLSIEEMEELEKLYFSEDKDLIVKI